MVIVSCYSYKGGSGRTTVMANVAVLLAKKGHSVACLDLDVAAPGLDVVFGIDECLPKTSIADFFRGNSRPLKEMCIEYNEDIYRSTHSDRLKGVLYVFPGQRLHGSHHRMGPLIRGIQDRLIPLVKRISRDLKVKYILLDARSGFTNESALLFVVSHKMCINLRFSEQHFRGTQTILNIIHRVNEARTRNKREALDCLVLLNDVPRNLERPIKKRLEEIEKEYAAVVARENKELRWKDRIVVLDTDFKKEEDKREHQELMQSYEKIVDWIIG